MPTLTITVVDPPASFIGMENIQLLVQTKTSYEPGRMIDGNLVFEVPYELRNGNPSGAAVQRANDGRRFVYLSWLNTKDHTMFRRLKVFFDKAVEDQISVDGRDAKGGPACASAVVL